MIRLSQRAFTMKSQLHELFHHPARPDITNRDLAEFFLFLHEEIMTQFTDLQAAVAAEDTVIQGAVTLINGIAARIAAAAGDPQATQALIDDINAQASTLAAAVSANTVTGS